MTSIVKKIKRFISFLFHYFDLYFTPPLQYAVKRGVMIGTDNFIADNFCWSTEPFLVTIGSHCQITGGVKLLTHGGSQAARKYVPDMDIFGKISLGDYVYLGTNSLIMPGVTIGDCALVAAGSVVTKSIPSGVVVGGNPAKIICTIEEYIERNSAFNTGTKGLSHELKMEVLLTMEEEKFIKKAFMKYG